MMIIMMMMMMIIIIIIIIIIIKQCRLTWRDADDCYHTLQKQ